MGKLGLGRHIVFTFGELNRWTFAITGMKRKGGWYWESSQCELDYEKRLYPQQIASAQAQFDKFQFPCFGVLYNV